MEKQEVGAIVCLSSDGGIGKNGKLLFSKKEVPLDMEFFKKTTENSVVILGRITWMGLFKKPLPGRDCIIVSKELQQRELPDGSFVFPNIGAAFSFATQRFPGKKIFFMGGVEIYHQGFHYCDKIYVTEVAEKREADVYVQLPNNIEEISRDTHESDETGTKYAFVTYRVIKDLKEYEIVL
jgi:dihydrofolate reductase